LGGGGTFPMAGLVAFSIGRGGRPGKPGKAGRP